MVGALVVRDGVVIGEGYHAEYGGDHGEVAALRAAGEAARGQTLYVTLEPCAHYGKTPPCTDAILAAGIRRVVFAAHDPTEHASGGAEILRAAGLEVVGGVEEDAARRQNAIFFHSASSPLPFVALKFGLTLDARIAASPEKPSQVTGRTSLARVHRLRAGFDAIMVGGRTARVDDPLLTVRGNPQPRKAPVRVILDPGADLPVGSRLVRTVDSAPVWVVCAEDAPRDRRKALAVAGVRVLTAPRSGTGLDLHAALGVLRGEGVASIWCEGGGRLGAALLNAELVQRMYLVYAPKFYGDSGVPAFPDIGAQEGLWTLSQLRRSGNDALLVLDRKV